MQFAFPLRFLIPGLLLISASLMSLWYVQHRTNASDQQIQLHLDREARYLGPQLSAAFIDAYALSGLRGGLRQLIRNSTRPDIRLTLVINQAGEVIFINKPEHQGLQLEALPDPPRRNLVEAARQSMEGLTSVTDSGDTLWGLFPVELYETGGENLPAGNLVLALAYDAAMVRQAESTRIHDEIAMFLGGIGIISLLIWFVLRRLVTQRIERLADAAHRFVERGGDVSWDVHGKDEIGRLAHDLVEMGRDLHVRYQELAAANAELAEEIEARRAVEQELRLAASVFSSTSDGIVISDRDNRILQVNDAFVHVTGFSREEIVGNTPAILNSGLQDAGFYQVMWKSLSETGHWRGEIRNRRKNGEIYAEILDIGVLRDAAGEITNYVGVFTDISELKLTQGRLEKLAHFDDLTGLPNRVLIADRMSQAISRMKRSGQKLAVAYLDIDGFKEINDTYGHEIGDRLLTVVAERMQLSMRECDTLARLGGDEFVALYSELDDTQVSLVLVQRLLAAAARPVEIDGRHLQVSASIGLTFFPQEAETEADQLLRQADQAMYLAKQAGRNRYHLFDPEQDKIIHQRYELVEDLQHAITTGQFEVYYQPKLNLASARIYGAEALIRWNHPERGLVPPGAFLPLIETHDIIVDIDQWVLESVLRQMKIWHAAGEDLIVSVNIAARDLQREDFFDRLSASLKIYPDLPPGRLELEILESAALEDTAHIRRLIERCRQLGVTFSLDDFGAGYASLTYLKEIPAETLKIDQGFVRDILVDKDDLALVTGVIGLARAFRRKVVAEGVETTEHGELLMLLGCENLQGYGIARPMPIGRFDPWLATFSLEENWLRGFNREDSKARLALEFQLTGPPSH
jgi:diguanylate cyclase (GGDEF)-like protein/PAS domain S-box-containing protein